MKSEEHSIMGASYRVHTYDDGTKQYEVFINGGWVLISMSKTEAAGLGEVFTKLAEEM